MKRWIFWIVVVIVAAAATAWALQPRPREVDVAVAESGTMREFIEERGKTRLSRTYRITMPLSGRIEDVTLSPGDDVVAGQIVAQMQPHDLQTDLTTAQQRLGQFEQMIAAMDRTIEAAAHQSAGSEEQFQVADKQFKRLSKLSEQNVTTESELDAAELAVVEARVDHLSDVLMEQALSAFRKAAGLARDEALEQETKARRDFDRADVVSPIDGVVLERHVTNSRVLSQGEPLLDLGDWNDLEVEVEVLTQDAAKIREGQTAEITASAFGETPVFGTVKRIDPQAFTKVSSLGVEQQRVLVIIAFDESTRERLQQADRVGVGYRVSVKIITAVRDDSVIIPRAAAFRDTSDGWAALINRDGRIVHTILKTGLENPYEIEVLEGVSAGDHLLLAPDEALQPGTLVESHVVE